MAPITSTQVQIQAQAALRKQLEDDVEQRRSLLTETAVEEELKRAPAEKVVKDVQARGVDFDLTPGVERRLHKAQASEAVIAAVRQAGPKVRAHMAKLALGLGPAAIQNAPQDQARDLATILSQSSPDKTLAWVDRFAKKYPVSALLSCVYAFGADAYQQQGDLDKVVEYTGKSLKAYPDNLMALVLRVAILPQPQYLRSHATDRDRILQEAQSDGGRALELIQQSSKAGNGMAAVQQERSAEVASQIHGSLGMVHLELATGGRRPDSPNKAELAKAEMELNTALTATAHPDPRDCYRLGEAYALDGKLEAAIRAFAMAGSLGQGTLIKTYAEEQIAQINKRKAQDALASNAGVVTGK
jgi:tetratricopeptide (TPR) repeat protein